MDAPTAFYKGYCEAVDKRKNDLDEWVEQLKTTGIKAAHPDDGWVNREDNEVHLAYPHFERKIDVGDTIALGEPAKHRIVVVASIQERFAGMVYYKFIDQQDVNKWN